MSQLKFSVGQAEGVATQLSNQSKKILSIVDSLNKDINQVEQWWKGESSSAFIGQYKRFEPSLKELSTLSQKIAEQMRKISSIKQEQEKKIAGMFK